MGGKQRTQEEFVDEVGELYPDLEIISSFTETKNRVRVLCKKCGTESNPLAQSLIQKLFCCQKCRHIKNKENFLNRLSSINPSVEVVGEYKNFKTKIKCLCLIHNETFEMTPSNLIGGHGCPKCGIDARIEIFARTHDDFTSELQKISPTINVKSKYVSEHKKVQCQCSVCNYEWETTPHILLKGSRCPNCNLPSKGEIMISKILDSLNIEYIQQKKFKDCRNQLPLSFDFYIPTYNLCIEYQGQQHYEVVNHFGGEQGYEIRQKRDNIKVDYCKKNNIGLLCIPYWDFDNIKQIINDFLNERRT